MLDPQSCPFTHLLYHPPINWLTLHLSLPQRANNSVFLALIDRRNWDNLCAVAISCNKASYCLFTEVYSPLAQKGQIYCCLFTGMWIYEHSALKLSINLPALSFHMMLPTVLEEKSHSVAQGNHAAFIRLVQGRPALLVSEEASNDGYDALAELRGGNIQKRKRLYKLELWQAPDINLHLE